VEHHHGDKEKDPDEDRSKKGHFEETPGQKRDDGCRRKSESRRTGRVRSLPGTLCQSI
jgi:hypothetical protein